MKVLESKTFLSLCFVLVINWMEAIRFYEETGDNAGSLNLGKIKLIYLVQELPEASAETLFQREERSPGEQLGLIFSCLQLAEGQGASAQSGGSGLSQPGPQLCRALWPRAGASLGFPIGRAGQDSACPLGCVWGFPEVMSWDAPCPSGVSRKDLVLRGPGPLPGALAGLGGARTSRSPSRPTAPLPAPPSPAPTLPL